MKARRIRLTKWQDENATLVVRAGLAAGVKYRRIQVLPDGSVAADFDAPDAPNHLEASEFALETEGKVYIVGFDRWVKIGFTRGEIHTRMLAIQTSLPVPLTLLASLQGTFSTEKMLHQRFAEYRASGEWFRREGAVSAWIEEGCPL